MKLIVCEIAKLIKMQRENQSNDLCEQITNLKLKAYCELTNLSQLQIFKKLGVL